MSDRPNFMAMLKSRQLEGKLVCVGLDPVYEKLPLCVRRGVSPAEAVFDFTKDVVLSTAATVCAFKPNISFWPKVGNDDRRGVLRTMCAHIHGTMPGVPLILDAKRGDIGNSNGGYVTEAFEEFDADAVTVNPYLGAGIDDDGLDPFLKCANKGIIVLCRTSNKSATRMQDRMTEVTHAELDEFFPNGYGDTAEICGWKKVDMTCMLIPYYQFVALEVNRWNKNGNCALVVGATAPNQLAKVRHLVGDMPILVPGVGAQGGDLAAVLKAGLTSKGDGLIINASRSILYAFEQEKKRDQNTDESQFAAFARAEVDRMNSEIQTIRRGG